MDDDISRNGTCYTKKGKSLFCTLCYRDTPQLIVHTPQYFLLLFHDNPYLILVKNAIFRNIQFKDCMEK